MNRFDYFIILAEMRTGSNFLETNLNKIDGLTCHGEAFNPSFVGYPKTDNLFGIGLEEREKDPWVLLDAIKASPGLGGFRFFHNHDPRILAQCLVDHRCAKIILTRNPIDRFISLRIAQSTGQWKLTNAKHSKSQQVTFDADDFQRDLGTTQAFQVDVLNTLQKSGQAAFYLAYEDLQDVDVINGLGMFLGADARLDRLDKTLKKQNPQDLAEKVLNFAEMESALAGVDKFNLHRTPHFEPRRGPAIPTYLAAPQSGLLYMPLRSGPDAVVGDWLAQIDGAPPSALLQEFTQKTLRQWMRDHSGFRSFTVLRHPVARAHAAFCDRILFDRPGNFSEIRNALRRVHKLPIPSGQPDDRYDHIAHKAAFLGFLQFLRRNLSGQTSIRVDPAWASQMTLLQGMAQFAVPDVVLREDRLSFDLPALAMQVGAPHPPKIADTRHTDHARLVEIYDAEIESAARDAYPRDYLVFGFENWAQAA